MLSFSYKRKSIGSVASKVKMDLQKKPISLYIVYILSNSIFQFPFNFSNCLTFYLQVPNPRPGSCTNNSQVDLNDASMNFIKSHPLMNDAVQPFFPTPLLIQTGFKALIQLSFRFWRQMVRVYSQHHKDVCNGLNFPYTF